MFSFGRSARFCQIFLTVKNSIDYNPFRHYHGSIENTSGILVDNNVSFPHAIFVYQCVILVFKIIIVCTNVSASLFMNKLHMNDFWLNFPLIKP